MAWDMRTVSQGFKAPYQQPANTIVSLTKGSLAWAALTVGRPNKAAVQAHGQWSISEALYRWHMVLSSLELPAGGGFPRYSPAFNALDATEKGGVNFFLGMMMAKLVAQKQLGVPWLHHLDNFELSNAVSKKFGKYKPDFVGFRPSDGSWHVIEAKARCGSRSLVVLNKAVKQSEMVSSVNGSGPATCIGTLLYPDKSGLRFEWKDPTDPDDGFKLKDTQDVWRAYYELPWALHNLPAEEKAMFRQLTGLSVSLNPEVVELVEGLISDQSEGGWTDRRGMLAAWSAESDLGQRKETKQGESKQDEAVEHFSASDGIQISIKLRR